MRAHGPVTVASGLARDSHVCWVYDDPRDLAAAARQYLANGLARGEQLLCVGDDSIEAVVAALPDADRLRERGVLTVLRLADAYAVGAAIVPEEQYDFYAAQAADALAAGFTGLRVVGEVSALVADPAWVPEHLRWEHLADDLIARGAGLSALCAYRADRVDAETLADLESVHPLVRARPGGAPFRLFFDRGRLALAGTLDAFGADRLERVLARTHVTGPVVTLDLRALDFADARGCATVAAYATRLAGHSAELHVVGAPPVFRRVWGVLGYDRLDNATIAGDRR